MRKFYLFRIANAYYKMEKRTPSYLFHLLNELSKEDTFTSYEIDLLKSLILPTKKSEVKETISKLYKDCECFTNFKNNFKYTNYLTKENTELIVRNGYIEMKTTALKPTFLSPVILSKEYLACDFENKDYFWIESIA